MKKKLLIGLSALLVVVLGVAGSLAYYNGSDLDVNVMTFGNVRIEHIEQEWNESKTELVDFTQLKPLNPYVGALSWENLDYNGAATGAYRRFTMKNVVDKYVSVKNVGRNDAYVRTFIALEMGEYATEAEFEYNVIGTSTNAVDGAEFDFVGTWNWSEDFVTTIDGQNFLVKVATHQNALKSGETTIPSLLQVYLNKTADEKTIEKLDGNENGKYDILVFSQAVQVDGFEDKTSEEALNETFGVPSTTSHPWTTPSHNEIETLSELEKALLIGGTYTLSEDIEGEGETLVANGSNVTLNLNGHSITNTVSGAPALINYGKLTITGDGEIKNETSDTAKSHTIRNYGELVIEGGKIGTFATSGSAVVNDGITTINGGEFASRQESPAQYGQGPAAYTFVNNAGKMTINDAIVNGPTHGLFGAYAGELIVNGGNYTLIGNNGMGCYVVYATGASTVVKLNGGVINTNEPRHGRVFYVYDNGNYFNGDAVNTGKIVVSGATIYLNGVEQNY